MVAEIQNAMQAQLAMYSAIEGVLRRAASEGRPLPLAEIRATQEVKSLERGEWQVRDIVTRLGKKGFVTVNGSGQNKTYAWNLDAPPYIPERRLRAKATRDPSPVADPMQHNVVVQPDTAKAAPTVAQAIELVVAGVSITIDKNPTTGLPRIIIGG